MVKIEAKFRDLFKDTRTADRIRRVQELERVHLDKRVAINDKMVKMAQQMFSLNKRRILDHDEDVDEVSIEAYAES